MSFHLIHILKHASSLTVDRGCLVCRSEDAERRVPLADILAVIVAARGVSFSADCLAALMENGAAVIHCDHNYRPIGKTMGLHRVVHNGLFQTQIAQDGTFSDKLWSAILDAKISNQAYVLDAIGAPHNLHEKLNEDDAEESASARYYWKYYFQQFGSANPGVRTRPDATDPVNGMLNYGYAVIGSIMHRSMLAHGFDTTLGVHHKYRFRNDPLVYDFMEPLRPVCDYMLLRFRRAKPREKIDSWVKFAAGDLVSAAVKTPEGKKIKLLAAVDYYVSTLANCYRHGDFEGLFIPSLKGINFAQADK